MPLVTESTSSPPGPVPLATFTVTSWLAANDWSKPSPDHDEQKLLTLICAENVTVMVSPCSSRPGVPPPSVSATVEMSGTAEATVSERFLVAVAPAVSVSVTATVDVPAVVGVPEITPVVALTESPAGSPVADQVYGAVPPDPVIVVLYAVSVARARQR